MDQLQVLNYKGKEILFLDLSGTKGPDLEARVIAVQNEIIASRRKDYLLLIDFTDAFANEGVMKAIGSENGKLISEKSLKFAVTGIVGIKKILLKSINLFAKNKVVPFDTLEAAKEYLVSAE